jgi:acyl-CoA thioester hydrolase
MTSSAVPNYPSLAQNPARLTLENYPVQFELPLRWSDVVNGRCIGSVGIARYFEDARMNFIAELIGRSGMVRSSWNTVIRQCSIEAVADMVYPGKVTAGCSILRVGNTSYQGGYGIFQNGVCVALSDATLVWIDDDYRPIVPLDLVTATLKKEMLRS